MSREIKFRAWDGSKMTDRFRLSANGYKGAWVRVGGATDLHEREPDYKIMQYTGLKDRNGVEIYEGDILKVWDWGVSPNNKLLGITRVHWCEDSCGWRYQDNNGELAEDFYDEFRCVEVIGNIYENPELLEDTP